MSKIVSSVIIHKRKGDNFGMIWDYYLRKVEKEKYVDRRKDYSREGPRESTKV